MDIEILKNCDRGGSTGMTRTPGMKMKEGKRKGIHLQQG